MTTLNLTHISPIVDREELVNLMNAIFTPYLLEKHKDPDLSGLFPGIKKVIIDEALIHTRGNQMQAAKVLGINRYTLKRIHMQQVDEAIYPL